MKINNIIYLIGLIIMFLINKSFATTLEKQFKGLLHYDQIGQLKGMFFDPYTNKPNLSNISAYLNEKLEELSFDKKDAIKFEQYRKQPEQVNFEIFCEKINDHIQKEVIHFSNPIETYTVIGKSRLYFYSAPDKNCKISNNLFVIPSDIGIPYFEYNNYFYVSYSENTDITGWVYKDRLQPTGKYLGPISIIDE